MVVKFYMPGEEDASLEQLAYEQLAYGTGGENCKTNYQFRADQNLDEIIQQLKSRRI